MSESKKKKAGQQANKASDTTHAATLGDRLQAQLETLRAALPATTGAQEFARKQLSERDVMGLVFAAQTDSSIEISWDELDVVPHSPRVRPTTKKKQGKIKHTPASPESPAEPTQPDSGTEEPAQAFLQEFLAHRWAGNTWDHLESRRALELANHAAHHEALATADLTDEQRQLLRRVPKRVLTINLRLLTRKEAIEALEKFVARARMLRLSYLRIICGKGIGSSQGAVLRPALSHWCGIRAQSGELSFSPDPDSNREFGGFILELHYE